MTTTPRLMAKHKDQRVTGSVFHSYRDCIRLAPALEELDVTAVEVNDQTVEILGLKLCGDCVRKAESDPHDAITRACAAATGERDADGALPLPDVDRFLAELGLHGFEVRRRPKPRTKS